MNLIGQDGVSIRTQRVRKTLPLAAERDGFACLKTAPYLKMAVFNRYGRDQHGIGLLTRHGRCHRCRRTDLRPRLPQP